MDGVADCNASAATVSSDHLEHRLSRDVRAPDRSSRADV
jgi:hypothetical protein